LIHTDQKNRVESYVITPYRSKQLLTKLQSQFNEEEIVFSTSGAGAINKQTLKSST
jgi:hypothetical protein